jgi:hypothetical protein
MADRLVDSTNINFSGRYNRTELKVTPWYFFFHEEACHADIQQRS